MASVVNLGGSEAGKGGKVVYIANGQVLDSRSQSPWRLSLITDFFWGITEFVVLFFKTLLQQDVKKRRGYGNSSDSRYDDGRGPPGNPPRRMEIHEKLQNFPKNGNLRALVD
uniref:Selenoprotein K n=1 Tax=Prolemur simus TaxID=1328070 RepID=A0A8C8Z9C8_PROSS